MVDFSRFFSLKSSWKDWIIVIILIISMVSVLIFIFSDRNSTGMLEEGFYDAHSHKKNMLL